jgi:hypothetical protein
MRCRLKCEKPDDIEFTMTITMTAKDWCELRDQLQIKWPSSSLSNSIDDLLAQARKIYWPKDAD